MPDRRTAAVESGIHGRSIQASGEDEMTEHVPPSLLRFLEAAACIVIISWGVNQASHLIMILLFSLLLAYCILPLPKWVMHRFKLSKSAAIALTVSLMGIFYLVASIYLAESAYRMMARLPTYEEDLKGIFEQVAPFLNSHGIQFPGQSGTKWLSSDRIIGFAREGVPAALGLLSDRVLIGILSLLAVILMAEEEGNKTRLVAQLEYYGRDVQRFIAISAKTGAITAFANLVLLAALGVDFPVLWCVLYFFLHFIPNVGFIIALVPPTLLALLTLGWKRALLVAGGMVLTNLVADYVLTPIFMKKGVDISFLEIMLSLIVWGALLGPASGIVAIPLTVAFRKFAEGFSKEGKSAMAPSG
jgi:AI-2 transport protein TqsA